MANSNIKSKFQFLDNYIRKSSMEIYIRNTQNSKLELGIEVEMSEIKEETERVLSAELRLKNEVLIVDKDSNKLLIKIDVEMAGIFKGENMSKEEFSKFIKYSGTPIVSQAIRAYVMNISALGGINTIRLPLINYVEFFKNNSEVSDDIK